MKILALDIGAGTEDILLYDTAKENIENCIKIVLPSPTQIFAAKIREITQLRQDVLIKGDIIGGGAFTSSLKKRSSFSDTLIISIKVGKFLIFETKLNNAS